MVPLQKRNLTLHIFLRLLCAESKANHSSSNNKNGTAETVCVTRTKEESRSEPVLTEREEDRFGTMKPCGPSLPATLVALTFAADLGRR